MQKKHFVSVHDKFKELATLNAKKLVYKICMPFLWRPLQYFIIKMCCSILMIKLKLYLINNYTEIELQFSIPQLLSQAYPR